MIDPVEAAVKIRARILNVSSSSGEGHVPSSLSVVEGLVGAILFLKAMSLTPLNLVLSKGHAALGLFATLSELGYVPEDSLEGYSGQGSLYGGHPDSLKVPYVALSSGSLGHGLPFACGVAHSYSVTGSGDSPVLVLVGDGELNEGSNWEALMLGASLNLKNLIVIVDDNNSSDRGSKVKSLDDKFRGFGLNVLTVAGHDAIGIFDALISLSASDSSAPSALIMSTKKGKGVAEMEQNPEAWHHRSPTEVELARFLEEVSG